MAHQTIRVLFIDAESGSCFAMTESPTELLPETFEVAMTVTVEETDWDVVRAEPGTREEWEQSGELRLTLRREQERPSEPPGGA